MLRAPIVNIAAFFPAGRVFLSPKMRCIKSLFEITLECFFLIGKIWDLIAGNEPAGAEAGRILTFEGREAIG